MTSKLYINENIFISKISEQKEGGKNSENYKISIQ
jgi:hypothetical protein